MKLDAKTILSKAINVTPDEITDEATPESYNSWDSLAHVNLIMLLEEQLERKLETNEIITLNSLSSIENILRGE